MPKKTTVVTTEEEVKDVPEKELNYKDDLQGKTIRQIAEEDQKEPAETVEEKKEEKPATEEKKEEGEEVEFDPEQLKKDVAEETSKKIVEALQGKTEAETKTNKDEYRDWALGYFAEHGKEPDYTAAFEFLEDRAFKRLEEKQQEKVEQVETEKQTQLEQQKAAEDQFNKELDEELTDLYRNNKLPKVKDENDPNDYGLVARKALFQTMIDVNTKRVATGEQPIRSVSRIFTNYYKAPNRQPAGVDAPINNGKTGSVAVEDDQEINYIRDIKGGFKNIFRGKR